MKDIKKVIINASAAKTGGAETIIKTFIESIPHTLNIHFIVFSPISFQDTSNVTYISKSTTGFNTMFFSVLGVLFYMIKYKTKRVISFNNINCLLFSKHGITYFHQYKLLDSGNKEIKIKLYKYIIHFFLRKNQFIVQSNLIKDLFELKFSKLSKPVISCWPGFIIPKLNASLNFEKGDQITGILPIAYNAPHKNVQLLLSLQSFFEHENLKIITLFANESDVFENKTVFNNIGTIERDSLFKLYDELDFLIFTSKLETVGLPIFEFLQTGKPAFVYEADYVVYFQKQFNQPENLILFKDVEDFKRLFLQKINTDTAKKDYSKGEWGKIFKLL